MADVAGPVFDFQLQIVDAIGKCPGAIHRDTPARSPPLIAKNCSGSVSHDQRQRREHVASAS